MGYIAKDDLIANMTPEQKILVQQIYSQFDIGGGAVNKKIINVEPLFYQGIIAGNEFLNYSATKLYLCLLLQISTDGSIGVRPLNSVVDVYNEANGRFFAVTNSNVYWDATAIAPAFSFSNAEAKNFYFGRLAQTTTYYSNMTFIGYRITLGTV